MEAERSFGQCEVLQLEACRREPFHQLSHVEHTHEARAILAIWS